MLIDSHVNLHAPQFDEDRDAVIARAREAGVVAGVSTAGGSEGSEGRRAP